MAWLNTIKNKANYQNNNSICGHLILHLSYMMTKSTDFFYGYSKLAKYQVYFISQEDELV